MTVAPLIEHEREDESDDLADLVPDSDQETTSPSTSQLPRSTGDWPTVSVLSERTGSQKLR